MKTLRLALCASFMWSIAALTVQGAESVPKAVVVLVDKLAFEDFQDFAVAAERFEKLTRQGAIGMMNVRTLGGANAANGYLSLASGTRAEGGAWTGHAFDSSEQVDGESAAARFQRLTGRQAAGSVVHLGIGELSRLRGKLGAEPWLIGEALKSSGRSAAVVGNADALGEARRFGALLAMDARGEVPLGVVGANALVDDPLWPAGTRMSDDAAALTLALLEDADVVVVDWGDLSRLEAMEPLLEPARARQLRESALVRLGDAVEAIVDSLSRSPMRWRLYLASPSPSTALGREGILLTPVFRWTEETFGQSALLTSMATQRRGIVTNADFAATLLDDLAAGGGARSLRAWSAEPEASPFQTLLEQYAAIKSVHLQRLPVIQPYFFSVLAFMATGVALTLLVRHRVVGWNERADKAWRLALATVLSFPAALLLLPLFGSTSLGDAWLRLLAIAGGITILSWAIGRRRPLGAVGAVALATAALIAWDTARGSPLMQKSLLGYDPVAGSRYYGIGNEYMGALLGAASIATAYLLANVADARKALWPVAVFAGLFALLLHPRLGINVGGALSSAAAAFAAYAFLSDRPRPWRAAAAWLFSAVIVVGSMGALDSLSAFGSASHLGQAVRAVSDQGADPLWTMVGRKVAVNLKLIRLTVWSRVALSSFILLGVTLFHPNWLAQALAERSPWLFRMAKVAVVGAFVALIANDSGVVAASTFAVWPALAVLSVSIRLADAS